MTEINDSAEREVPVDEPPRDDPGFDRREGLDDDGSDGDRADSSLEPVERFGVHENPDADEAALQTVDHRAFSALYADAKIREDQRGEALVPGRLCIDGARQPWAENPLNPEPERYPENVSGQAALEEHFATHGFDRQTLSLINAGADREARRFNCADCARATASCMDGQPLAARALLRGLTPEGKTFDGEFDPSMEAHFARPGEVDRNQHGRLARTYDETTRSNADAEVERGFDALSQELEDAGPGAHAVVALTWKPDPFQPDYSRAGGHWLNAANRDGRIVFIDSQQAEIGALDSDFMREYRIDAAEMSWIRSERR